MRKYQFRHLLNAILFVAIPSCSYAQELHSSVEPSHVVRWDISGLHSSVDPTLWVNGEKMNSAEAKERQPLKEPIIPFISREAKEQAMKDMEQDKLASASLYQTGQASYYSAKMHGRKMANGESYDRNGLICAHRTLPFGTKIRVVNKKNGKEVIVRVTDRGPFGKGRVIDLSNKAAADIGMLSDGVVPVELYVVGN